MQFKSRISSDGQNRLKLIFQELNKNNQAKRTLLNLKIIKLHEILIYYDLKILVISNTYFILNVV